MRVRLVGLVALIALVAASCGGAAPEAEGPSEGIQVHGDWTIDIINEDGTLDEHLEFSNALTTGDVQLTDILTRTSLVGGWEVALFNGSLFSDTGQPCANDSGSGVACYTTEVTTWDSSSYFPNLVVDSPERGVVRLAGSVVIANDTNIDGVQSRLALCPAPTDDCLNAGWASGGFTQKLADDDALDGFEATPVQAGQTVQVQVEISFTSG